MRNALLKVCRDGHPALWLGAHVRGLDDADKSHAFCKAAAWKPPEAYGHAYERWTQALQQLGARTEELVAHPSVIVGLSGGSPLETSVTLLHPYGTPLIPGSALKGLACAYAEHVHSDRISAEHLKVLFGEQECAGFVTFMDAWWVPGSCDTPLHRDIMTPHHTAYYSTGGQQPPTDFDDPTPVGFVHARGKFLAAIAAENDAWRDFAFRLVRAALADWGVGAKTAAGYGRLMRDPAVVAEEERLSSVDQTLVDMVKKMGNPKGQAKGMWQQIKGHHSEPTRRAALELFYPKLRDAGMLKDRWINEKPDARAWVREVEEECRKLGIPSQGGGQ